jgi:hypothetical protein
MDEFLTVAEIAAALKGQRADNGSTVASSRRCVSARDGFASGNPTWTRFLPPAQPAVLEHADDEAGAQAEAVERNSRDQLLGALTEIPRTAAEDPHDMASALRELAAAAEALTASPRTSRGTGGWSHDRATARHERSCQAPERPSVVGAGRSPSGPRPTHPIRQVRQILRGRASRAVPPRAATIYG